MANQTVDFKAANDAVDKKLEGLKDSKNVKKDEKNEEKKERKTRRRRNSKDNPTPKAIDFSKFQKTALKHLLYKWEKVMVPELFDRALENKNFKDAYGITIAQAEKQIMDLNKKLSI